MYKNCEAIVQTPRFASCKQKSLGYFMYWYWAIPEIVRTPYMLRRCDIQGSQGKIKSRLGPKKGKKIQGGSEKKAKNPGRVWKKREKIQGGSIKFSQCRLCLRNLNDMKEFIKFYFSQCRVGLRNSNCKERNYQV